MAAYKRISPQPVVEGGTGAQTFTSHGVLLGNTTSAISATAEGATGTVLTGSTGNPPSFQAPAASSISITGNSGGALTGNAFTFTGGTSGLTFAGAGTTETLGGTLAIANGGTNATSMTNTDGVVYYDGTRLVTTTVGTATNILTSNGAGVAPTFQAPAASSISITGNSGGALTGNAFTFTGGTTGLTFAGAGSTETLGGTLAIANGGTNATSMANTDGVVYYDGTRLVTTAVGTSTYVLTSNGAGVAPTFQVAGGGSSISTINIQSFTSSGTYTPTASMKYCIIECVGGGAGGGAASNAGGVGTEGLSGGGGGSGSYSRKISTAAAIGASQTVTIGAAGSGGSAGTNPGNNGGDTSVGSICIAKGGTGGGAGIASSAISGAGGAGGIAGTGDFTSTGMPGFATNYCGTNSVATLSPCGGSSIFGGGAVSSGALASITGANATNYGSGGAGGAIYNHSASAAGGNGSAGVVIITEYI